jgi:galactan endo-1,6-beta-galactosidase
MIKVLSATVAVTGSLGASISPNPSQTFGEWQAWGTSLAWFANTFGNRPDLADAFFTLKNVTVNELQGTVLPGLGLNSARYNVGGCSFNSIDNGGSIVKMVASPNIPDWKQIHGFWLNWTNPDPTSSSWDFNNDLNQLTFTKLAQARGVNHFELFSNSPMWWMLYNLNPSGSPTGATDNLESWNWQQHAHYIANVASQFQKLHNITFTTVEATNEPIANWWTATGNQEGCHFDPETTAAVAIYLRQELDAVGLSSMKIASADESLTDQALETWSRTNSTARAVIDFVNVHGYQYEAGNRAELYNQVVVQGQKTLRNSEYGEGDPTGLRLATCFMLDFTNLHVSTLHYWQAIDSYNWGLLEGDVANAVIQSVNPKYYVFAQFTRHIREGMTMMAGGDPVNNTVAAYDNVNKKLVIVALNINSTQTLTFDLSKFSTFPPANTVIPRWSSNAALTGERYVRHDDTVLQANGQFQATFTPANVQTFEIDGVEW